MTRRRWLARSVALVAAGAVTWMGATSASVATAASIPAAVPMISVSPSSGLLDGQTVTVSGSGFPPTTTVYVSTCPAGATQVNDCDTSHFASAASDAVGAVTITYTVHRLIEPTATLGAPPLDCALVSCSIGATADPFSPLAGGNPLVPIAFATPQLTVAVDAVATLDPGTNAVVARATVTCDRATPISAFATFTQAGTDRLFQIPNEQCDPASPTQLFLAGYQPPGDPAYTMAPTSVAVIVAPFAGVTPTNAGSGATQVVAGLGLIDAGALRGAILAELADPANVALRDQVVQAIVTRIRQDPTFANAFAAVLATMA